MSHVFHLLYRDKNFITVRAIIIKLRFWKNTKFRGKEIYVVRDENICHSCDAETEE